MTEIIKEWEIGTAYDFFMSLWVIHAPKRWSLRPSWAAGVRSRLSAENREFLKTTRLAIGIPLRSLSTLPAPKDAEEVLNALQQLSAEERIDFLGINGHGELQSPNIEKIYRHVCKTGEWTAQDVQLLQQTEWFKREKKSEIENTLYWWANYKQFGRLVLVALDDYYTHFFEEEEKRLLPYLESAVKDGQALAESTSLTDLIIRLTGGIVYTEEELNRHQKLIFSPSFWVTPLMVPSFQTEQAHLLFGARPYNASLITGETIPLRLQQTVKALSDATRLQILKILSAEPQTHTQLTKRLRLRPSTMSHHLDLLRSATLISIEMKGSRQLYSARPSSLEEGLSAITDFIYPHRSTDDNNDNNRGKNDQRREF